MGKPNALSNLNIVPVKILRIVLNVSAVTGLIFKGVGVLSFQMFTQHSGKRLSNLYKAC